MKNKKHKIIIFQCKGTFDKTCRGCPFRNETERGSVCNLDDKFWYKKFRVIIEEI